MSQFASKDDLIAAQAVRIAELESQLEAIGAGGVEPLRKGFVRLTDVLARLEQGFGANSAPVTTIKRHFEMQAHPAHPAEGVPAQAAQPSDALIEAVDAWFAENTGLGGCSDKDVSELAEIFATHPTQQGLDSDKQRNADIGKAIMRACKELPEGVEIQIYLERGAGNVNMTDWDGNEFDHFDEAHNDFACRINAATDGAIAAEQFAAQAKQGGV